MPSYKTYGTVVRDVLEEMVSAVEAGEAAVAAIPPGSTGTCTVSSSPATVRRSGGPPPPSAAPVGPSSTKSAPAPMEWSPTPVPSSSPAALDAPSGGIFAASEHDGDNNNDGDNNDEDDADSFATVPKTMPTIDEKYYQGDEDVVAPPPAQITAEEEEETIPNSSGVNAIIGDGGGSGGGGGCGDSFTNDTKTSRPEAEPRGGGSGTAGTVASTADGSGGTIGIDAGNKTKKQIVEIPIIIAKKGKLGVIIGETKDDVAYVMAVSESVLDECRDLRPGDLLARSPLVCEMLGTAAARTFEYYRFKTFQHLCEWAFFFRFTAVRTVYSIQIDQPGPLGFTVEEYVPKGYHNDATHVFKQAFTRVSWVDYAQSSQVQVGDLICYPGCRGSDNIPRVVFNKMSSCRPLCFDVVRPAKGKDPDNTTTGTTTVAKGLSLAKQTKTKYNLCGLGLMVTIPITVGGAGKLGIRIGRRTSDGAVYITAVSESAIDDCQDLRPGDLLAMAPTSASATLEPSPFVPGGKAARTTYEYYSFKQFKNYCATSIRPLRFMAVRCIRPVRMTQPGSLGFTVEEYVPKNGDAEQIFTRVASVDASRAQSSQVQVGDLICRYGSRGSVNFPRDLFNKLSSCRPLCFDIIRRWAGQNFVANTCTMNKGTTTGTAAVAQGGPHRPKPALTAGPLPSPSTSPIVCPHCLMTCGSRAGLASHVRSCRHRPKPALIADPPPLPPPVVFPHASSGTMNKNTDGTGRASMASAKCPFDEDGRCTSSLVVHKEARSTGGGGGGGGGGAPQKLPPAGARPLVNNEDDHPDSFPPGVYLISPGKVAAQLHWGGKDRYLGTFDTVQQASAAYEARKQSLELADTSSAANAPRQNQSVSASRLTSSEAAVAASTKSEKTSVDEKSEEKERGSRSFRRKRKARKTRYTSSAPRFTSEDDDGHESDSTFEEETDGGPSGSDAGITAEARAIERKHNIAAEMLVKASASAAAMVKYPNIRADEMLAAASTAAAAAARAAADDAERDLRNDLSRGKDSRSLSRSPSRGRGSSTGTCSKKSMGVIGLLDSDSGSEELTAGAAGGAAAGAGARVLVARMKQEISELIQDDIIEENDEEELDLLLHIEGGLGKSDSRVMRQITVNANREEGGRLDATKLYSIMKKIGMREMDKSGEEAN